MNSAAAVKRLTTAWNTTSAALRWCNATFSPMSTTQSSAQLVPLCDGTQPTSTQYVDWLQVQGFLDMAESALKAKTAANEILLREKANVLYHLSQQTEQSIKEVRQGQAEDTTFLRQQLEALLRERAASKERIAGLERENSFLLDEREILFRQLEMEAGKEEPDRAFRSLLSARRSEEDMSALRHEVIHSKGKRHQSWAPTTPQESTEGAKSFPARTAAARGDDDNDAVDTEDMQQASFAHSGDEREFDGAEVQSVGRQHISFGASQPHAALRQPLQTRADHAKPVHLSQDSLSHSHQHSGDKHQSWASQSTGPASRPD